MEDSQFVFVLGPYRSGTSLTARIVSELGYSFGDKQDLIPADPRNPSGYLERDDTNATSRALIESAGRSLGQPGAWESLAQAADLNIARRHDLRWTRNLPRVGIKDPRMCICLEAWFAAGVFPPERCKAVVVTRDLAAITASALKHDSVSSYGNGDPGTIQKMSETYQQAAYWQVDKLGLPTFHIDYTELTENPERTIRKLAGFLGVRERRNIEKARQIVGKKRAFKELRRQALAVKIRMKLGAVKSWLKRTFGPSGAPPE